jgi:hypothetical protein
VVSSIRYYTFSVLQIYNCNTYQQPKLCFRDWVHTENVSYLIGFREYDKLTTMYVFSIIPKLSVVELAYIFIYADSTTNVLYVLTAKLCGDHPIYVHNFPATLAQYLYPN